VLFLDRKQSQTKQNDDVTVAAAAVPNVVAADVMAADAVDIEGIAVGAIDGTLDGSMLGVEDGAAAEGAGEADARDEVEDEHLSIHQSMHACTPLHSKHACLCSTALKACMLVLH
jgi:hypothetical protein